MIQLVRDSAAINVRRANHFSQFNPHNYHGTPNKRPSGRAVSVKPEPVPDLRNSAPSLHKIKYSLRIPIVLFQVNRRRLYLTTSQMMNREITSSCWQL